MNDVERTLREAARELPAAPPVATTRRLAERAADEGLLDVAYATVDSPLGPLTVAASPRGLVRVAYSNHRSQDDVLEDLAARISPRVLEAPERLDDARRELEEYFQGERTRFDLPIDWSPLRGLTLEVLRETAGIAFGELRTYAEVATGAGSPTRASRSGASSAATRSSATA